MGQRLCGLQRICAKVQQAYLVVCDSLRHNMLFRGIVCGVRVVNPGLIACQKNDPKYFVDQRWGGMLFPVDGGSIRDPN
jgi:hypothetical protein